MENRVIGILRWPQLPQLPHLVLRQFSQLWKAQVQSILAKKGLRFTYITFFAAQTIRFVQHEDTKNNFL